MKEIRELYKQTQIKIKIKFLLNLSYIFRREQFFTIVFKISTWIWNIGSRIFRKMTR